MGLIQHFESFYKAMKPALVDDKSSCVWISGLHHPLYNLVTHLCSSQGDLETVVDSLIKKFLVHLPHAFWVHPENRSEGLEEVLLARGYTFLAACPIMTWQVTPTLQPNFDVRRADDTQPFYEILTTTSKYDQILGENVASLMKNTDAEHYLGFIHDKPVGIVTLFCSGETGVVSNLATLDEYQRKGCGRALMLAVMKRASELGLKQLVLGTSPAAEKLYDSLGFKEQMSLRIYTKN